MRGDIYKTRGGNTLYVQLTNDLDSNGAGLFKMIKKDGKTVRSDHVERVSVTSLLPARREPRPSKPSKPYFDAKNACPECGCSREMGYVRGVSCPNCEYSEHLNFRDFLQKFES